MTTTIILLVLAIAPWAAGCSDTLFCQLTAILNGLDPEDEGVIVDCVESLRDSSLGGNETAMDEFDCNNDADDDGDGLEDCCDPDCDEAEICEFFNGDCP